MGPGDPLAVLRGSGLVSENAERPQVQVAQPPTPDSPSGPRGRGGAAGFDFSFGVMAELGKIHKALQDNVNAVDRLNGWLYSNRLGDAFTPRIWRASRITGGAASTYSPLQFQVPQDVGGPNGGFRWWLGAHFIMGTDPFTVVAGTVVALYVGGIPPNDGTTAPDIEAIDSSIRYSVTTLPWGGSFAPKSVVIQPNDTIYYVVKSAGNNQKLTGTLLVYEFRETMQNPV